MRCFRPRPQSVSPQSKFRPTLEALEARYCPDGAPTIIFSVAPLPYGNVLISGQVISDTSAANLHVNLGGVVGDFAETDYDGMFSTVSHADALGLVDANAMDSSWATGDAQEY